MKILYTLTLLIFCNMGNAQDREISERKPPPHVFEGVKYSITRHSFDSVYVEKEYQIAVFYEGSSTMVTAFKIKGVGVDKYFAIPFPGYSATTRKEYIYYRVFSSGKNTAEEDALIQSYSEEYQERLIKESEEAERLRKFIADNPWPYKTVFRGNTYTRTEFEDSDQGISGTGLHVKEIGETTERLKGDTAYPKDYLWEEGQSRHSAGSKIYEIEGFDIQYYIYVDGYIYANDAKQDAELESKLKKLSQDAYRRISWARARNNFEYYLKGSYKGGTGFSANTIQKMVDLMYPELDKPIPDGSLLMISTLYLDICHFPPIIKEGVLSGYLEINFNTSTDKDKEFSVQGHGSAIVEAHDLKKREFTSFYYSGAEKSFSHRLYSELIDNEIPAKAKLTSKQKPDSDDLLIRMTNGTYRSISYQELPESTQKAIEIFLEVSRISVH